MCADKSENDLMHKNTQKHDKQSLPVCAGNVLPLNSHTPDTPQYTADRFQQGSRIAGIILDVFNKHYRIFLRITHEARSRFIEADWEGEHAASLIRITRYTKRVKEASERLKTEFDLDSLDKGLWKEIKQHYIRMLYDHQQPELAETFYNSVFTFSFDRRYYQNNNIFVRPSLSTEYLSGNTPTYYSFYPIQSGVKQSIKDILGKFNIGLPYQDYERDVHYLSRRFKSQLAPERSSGHASYQFQIVSSLFYRNKAAYIVGRVFNGLSYKPFAIPIINHKGKAYVDALVADKKDITNLFSFARSYFMVYSKVPSAVVSFLMRMMPRKTTSELYTSIGLQKQGKSDFYRNFLHHLTHSSDQFKISSGTKGMVMSVFTLPSYPFVFKVINDHFAPPKQVTRERVKQKYQMVKMHDRVGRLADTLEFSHVSFPLSRFSKELIEELKNKISNSLRIEGDRLIIRHLYIEKRLKPLNLYLETATGKNLEKVLIEYGNAIKEMAAANIFPGDLLTKNFGVTRHGRVIFYDYDEIELLEDCHFRKKPIPRNIREMMASEPWYSIEPMDIFPEEFLPFMLSRPEHQKIFLRYHKDLLDADYWQSVQKNFREGNYSHVYPYSKDIRFKTLYSGKKTAQR